MMVINIDYRLLLAIMMIINYNWISFSNSQNTTCLAHRYSDVFRNSLFHHPSFLRDVIGSDQHIGMLSAPCFVSGVPLRACKHASSYYVHSPVAGKGMLESIFFLNVAPQKC